MNFVVIERKSNISRQEKYLKDKYFKKLIKLSTQFNNIVSQTFIKNMLYCEDNEEYKFLFTNFIIGYKEYQDQLIDLFDLFYKWNPFEKYQLRGIYLEFIVYQLLKEKYPKDLIYQECYIKIGSYNSHTWDILINLDDYPKFYECKFTPHNLKRKHINEMIGLTKILPTSLIFLVSLELRKRILDKLFTLKESHENNFTEKLEKINLITIEDFNKNNPF